jgi:hypothetical protein
VNIFSTKEKTLINFFLADELELEHLTDARLVNIEPSYRGPHIHLPIDKGHFEALIHTFQRGEV